MDFLAHWMDRTQLPARWFLDRLDLPRSTFQNWKARGPGPRAPAPRPPPPHTATAEEVAAGYRAIGDVPLTSLTKPETIS